MLRFGCAISFCVKCTETFPSLHLLTHAATYLYPSFQGLMSDNDTIRLGLDFQRMLRINHMLYIAARDHVFAINLGTSSEQIIPQQVGKSFHHHD
ncbi:hypothetical protein GOODEAATRI_024834 [Goodea atripinnis]|uniref:Uncharacterized protein n=1 Tax=Goodea atripinnis TaxID=208336 RepID=A0ABV0P7K5_9TELE